MADSETQVAVLKAELGHIKSRLDSIDVKLDNKYVTQEEHTLAIQACNAATKVNADAINMVVKVCIGLAAPIYAAVIALVFKVFTQ